MCVRNFCFALLCHELNALDSRLGLVVCSDKDPQSLLATEGIEVPCRMSLWPSHGPAMRMFKFANFDVTTSWPLPMCS